MVNRNTNKYLHQVRGWLPCEEKMKNQIMAEVSTSVNQYLTENPDANYQDIVARFGTPQQIAVSCVDEEDTVKLLNNLSIKRKIITIVSYAVALVAAAWLVIVGVALVQNYEHSNGYGNSYIVVE